MKKYILPLGVFLILSSAAISLAQWTQIGPNYGSSNDPVPIINDICTSSDTIFAANNVFGVHYSTNLGVTWCETGLQHGNNLGISISKGTILIGKDNINRSTDKGETWTGITSFGGIQSVAINNNIGMYCTTGGVYVSTNAGLSFTNPVTTGSYTAVAVSGNVCLAGNGNGVYRSTDYSFFPITLFPRAINSITVNGNSVYACSTTGIDISTDQGLTWNTTGMTMNVRSLTVYNGNLYCIVGASIYKSTNNGTNWNSIYTAPDALKKISSASNGLIAISNTLSFRSTNDGATWNQSKFHFMQAYTAFKTPTALYTSADNFGVYRSTDSGSNWVNPTNGLDFWSIRCFTQIGSMLFAGMNNVGVYNSNDDGFSWNPAGLYNKTVYTLLTNGTNLIAGTKNFGISYSTNSGSSWIQSTINAGTIYSVYSNGSRIFAGGIETGVYISTTGGTTWFNVPIPGTPVGSFAHINNYIFAGTGTGIFYSTNNGDNWAQTPFPYQNVNTLVTSGNYLFAGNERNGIFVSSNYGQIWTNINRNLSSRVSVSRMLVSGNDLYAATFTTSIVHAQISSLVGISNTSQNEIPDGYSLEQNYPNPFNPSTNINYKIKNSGFVSLKIYDILGNEITEIINENKNEGSYSITFDAGKYNLSSGVYFYKLNTGEFEDTKRMVLVK